MTTLDILLLTITGLFVVGVLTIVVLVVRRVRRWDREDAAWAQRMREELEQ